MCPYRKGSGCGAPKEECGGLVPMGEGSVAVEPPQAAERFGGRKNP